MRRREREVVSVRVKVCQRCHRLLVAGAIVCSVCYGYQLASTRCRIDRADVKAFKETYKENA